VSDLDAVTVTANPAMDHTVWIPGFRAGEVNRVEREDLSPGGKGVNVAAFLTALGLRVAVTGFLGSENEGSFDAFFRDRGILDGFVRVEVTTRTGIKIVDDRASETTDVNFPGFSVTEEDVGRLEERLGELAAPGRWVALTGSLPRGAPFDLYRRLAGMARERGGRVAVDTSGPALPHALAMRPDLFKPNRTELEESIRRALPDRAAVVGAADELIARGMGTLVVSMGAEGAVFVRNGEAVFTGPAPVKVASTVGAGDAMVAGTIAGIVRDLPLAEVAALATACSAVAIGRIGPHLDPDEVEHTAKSVRVELLR